MIPDTLLKPRALALQRGRALLHAAPGGAEERKAWELWLVAAKRALLGLARWEAKR